MGSTGDVDDDIPLSRRTFRELPFDRERRERGRGRLPLVWVTLGALVAWAAWAIWWWS